MAQNGLSKRVDVLEAATIVHQSMADAGRDAIVAKILEQADQLRRTPAPPLEMQPPIQRMIRAALADAEGTDGTTFVQVFWRAFVTRARAWRQGGVL
jgi:hypothetical protein